jgi:hypothetical protein
LFGAGANQAAANLRDNRNREGIPWAGKAITSYAQVRPGALKELQKMTAWWQPLIGVVLGWTLGQFAEWWRQRHRARRYKAAIYVELRDVHSTIKNRVLVIFELLKEFVIEHTIENYPADIPYPIFKAHFSEAVLQFSESERLALTHIYGLIDALNNNFSIMRSNWDTMSGDEMTDNGLSECAANIILILQ